MLELKVNMEKEIKKVRHKFSRFLRILGPGLITGAADDDPSGIATYSQTGAQFGYGQLWTALYMLPFMIATQEACARIGAVTGKGIAAVIREHYSKKILYTVVILVLVANTINIGADIGAMAGAAHLIIPLPFATLTFLFTAFILLLEIFTSYKLYARILKWLALTLLAYLATAFIVQQPWLTVIKATLIPHMEFNFAFLFIITGVLGTTISPYMFFWEASEEVEEEKASHLLRKNGPPQLKASFIRSMRIDNALGMVASEVTTWSILLVGGTVLHASGITNVQTAADAAKALVPLVHTFPNAGFLAQLVFAIGIIGLGLLSVPVLSGSAAYALSEAFDWRASLTYKVKRAHGFYGVITIATLIGLGINFIGINPVQALVYTAVINGVVAVPLLFLVARIAGNTQIMGEYASKKLSKLFVWLTFLGLAAAALTMIFLFFRG